MGVSFIARQTKVNLKRFDSEGTGHIGVVVGLESLHPGVRETALELEKQYLDLVANLEKERKCVFRKQRPLYHRWRMSKLLNDFYRALDDKEVKVESRLMAITRDTKIPRTEVKYLVKFSRIYPRFDDIKENLTWSLYRALLDIPDKRQRERAETLALQGKIRTDYEVRHVPFD